MPTFAQLLAEGFTVVLVAALLTGLLSIACAVALDPVRPFGEAGADAATRFFIPANQRKSYENQHRANERPTHLSPALPAAEARAEHNYRDPGQEYLELDLQELLDHIHDAQSPGRTQ
ncbi:hypothetical protein [Rothia nasimurium]|uniref:hypothetical protein n=1 Tax=Rothia nasimurium TaxID=85336 RepID=UPI001F40D637|nr:hypothetical protein [Rothia nasimurium]